MKKIKVVLAIVLLIGGISVSQGESQWVVGQAKINNKPVVYKFMEKLPSSEIRKSYPWLTVISWKYDGSTNNGMPNQADNEQLIALEDGLELLGGVRNVPLMAYTATGNNLKQFVFYIPDRDLFLESLNDALAKHPRYPIDINFYKDESWEDLSKLISDFTGGS